MDTMLEKVSDFMAGKRGIHYEHEVECEIGNQEVLRQPFTQERLTGSLTLPFGGQVRDKNPEESRTSVMEQLLAAVHNDAPFATGRKFA